MRFCIREYGHLVKAPFMGPPPENIQPIPGYDFDYLESRLYDYSEADTSETRMFLKPSLVKGRRALQVQNYVGVLQTPSGSQIEILPKIYGGYGHDLDDIQARGSLLRMIRYLRNAPFRKHDRALLAEVNLPLFEVFIGCFLQEVNRLVKRGIRSDYVAVQDNLSFLKGRLLFAENIRYNSVHRHRIFVEYDEYLTDRAENRLIRSALEKSSRVVTTSRNQRLCRELLFAFDGVPSTTNVGADLASCARDRSMAHYDQSLIWARLLLLDQSPLAAAGKTDSLSLLFPMERIFEDYVAHRLRHLLPDWQITMQAKDHYLLAQDKNKYFGLQPDLVLRQENIKVVADTKWKILGQEGVKTAHQSLNQADLYQMYAYGNKYLQEQDVKELYLIYPKSATFTQPLVRYWYEKDMSLFVVPFDLSPSIENVLLDKDCLLAQ